MRGVQNDCSTGKRFPGGVHLSLLSACRPAPEQDPGTGGPACWPVA